MAACCTASCSQCLRAQPMPKDISRAGFSTTWMGRTRPPNAQAVRRAKLDSKLLSTATSDDNMISLP